MLQMWHLGNDVVDIADRRCKGKAADERFLNRILQPGETDWLRSSPDPDRDLWILWAAKEAAFKSVSKRRGQLPVFHHSSFHIRLDSAPVLGPTLVGRACHEEDSLLLEVQVGKRVVHALTWFEQRGGATERPTIRSGLGRVPAPEGDWRSLLRPRFSDQEWDCISHLPSALTRLGARTAVARELGLDESRVEIACRPGRPTQRIPVVFLDGTESTVDLTLSHHGEYQAWAFTV